MDEQRPQWDRLAYYVQSYRAARGLSQKAVTANGGPSDTTLGKIESGEWRPSRGVDQTLDKLDAGLNWEPGSASQILAGGEPIYGHGQTAVATRPHGELTDTARVLVGLAIEADDVDDAASRLNTSPTNMDEAHELADDVQSLLIDIDRLTQRIHDEAVNAVGGDITVLRSAKTHVLDDRRRRRRLFRDLRPRPGPDGIL